MSFIKPIETDDATGLLARIYGAAIKRAGKVFQILRIQSNNANSLKASMDLYAATMLRESPITRRQREMMAVVVSKANGCHY